MSQWARLTSDTDAGIWSTSDQKTCYTQRSSYFMYCQLFNNFKNKPNNSYFNDFVFSMFKVVKQYIPLLTYKELGDV